MKVLFYRDGTRCEMNISSQWTRFAEVALRPSPNLSSSDMQDVLSDFRQVFYSGALAALQLIVQASAEDDHDALDQLMTDLELALSSHQTH